MKDRLLRCLKCNEVISLTPCDFSPKYREQPQVGILTITEDERRNFEQEHQGHQLERLEVKGDSYVSEHPWSEPTREGFFEALDSQGGSFVIKQRQERADEPMKYELVGRGCIKIENKEIEVQEAAIRQQLELEAKERRLVIAEWQINGFIGLLKAHSSFLLCKKIPIDQMLFNEHPLVVRVKLDKSSLFPILSLLKSAFDERGYQFIEDFVENHNDFSDILALKIKRRFETVAFECTNRLEG